MTASPGTSAPVRVVIIDDHPVFREGLGSLLASQADFRLVGQAPVSLIRIG